MTRHLLKNKYLVKTIIAENIGISPASLVYLLNMYVTEEEKIVARPGLEPRASRLPCEHSAN